MELPGGLRFGSARRLPVFLQTEAAECGLASLGMIACFHGHRIDLAGMRRRFTVSLKGATLAYLMQVAGRLHLAPRPLRLELEELGQLRAPCILHWDLNHFVVLKSADLEADYAALVKKRVEFEGPPQKQPRGTETVFRDPDGNSTVLHQA